MNAKPPSYDGYRFPTEIISHAVWLYYRFWCAVKSLRFSVGAIPMRIPVHRDH